MPRILADLPNEDIKWLEARAAVEGKSRASVLREAVVAFRHQALAAGDTAWLDRGFGIWKESWDGGDAVDWQRRERASWTRPWDDDYESVKAEFPDLFDAEDDRQRQIHLDMLAGRPLLPKSPA